MRAAQKPQERCSTPGCDRDTPRARARCRPCEEAWDAGFVVAAKNIRGVVAQWADTVISKEPEPLPKLSQQAVWERELPVTPPTERLAPKRARSPITGVAGQGESND